MLGSLLCSDVYYTTQRHETADFPKPKPPTPTQNHALVLQTEYEDIDMLCPASYLLLYFLLLFPPGLLAPAPLPLPDSSGASRCVFYFIFIY
jgi:hypothetical protein